MELNNDLVLINSLDKKLKTREIVETNGFGIFKINYCFCKKSNKELVFERANEYLDKHSEIINIIKTNRYINFLLTLSLSPKQEQLFQLPSWSVSHSFKNEDKEENHINKEENEDEPIFDKEKEINENLIEMFASLNYSNEVNKKLAKNIIKSII